MRLSPGRLHDLTGQAADSYIVCHATLPGMAPPGFRPAICRGFFDRFSTQALQVIRRLWGFLLVAPPGQPDPPPGTEIPEPGWVNEGRPPLPPGRRKRRRPRA